MNASLAAPDHPARIGPFPVLARLACGGMAEIFLAKRTCVGGFERRVVVKRMLPHLARDPWLAHALADEGRVMARLRHPNVVAVEELGHDDVSLYLVMEHLVGASLSAIARGMRAAKDRMHPALAMHVVAELCAGLHAAHELRDEKGRWLALVHRDVSPHNVFVTAFGEVKLLDFGIAYSKESRGHANGSVAQGKLGYMAAEQFTEAHPDRRTDVYAAGVVLHELLTGERLFGRATDSETVNAVLLERVPRPSERVPGLAISREVEDIVMCALSRDPAQRFETAEQMRDALRMHLGPVPPELRDALGQLAIAHGPPELTRPAPRAKESATVPAVRRTDVPPHSGIRRVMTEDVDGATRPPRPSVARPPPRRARWLLAGALATALGLAALASSEPTTTSTERVHLVIESVPSAAEVRVDDRVLGRTPIALELDREETPVVIALRSADHLTVTTMVVPDADRTLRIEMPRATIDAP
ncbi:serine/threonine protein kinase [Sandaracinus amylolyticus]|uniref:serine/threonine protein kinase n=1 Tax=Sandaracinus amylolyticus TaxID=927083 RepID=UPI001F002AAA|nr:serine/threonine-protein kinase [Sandaracinus amylolyticus]UJR81971.1 Serine/threonine protein kinase PrkC, regulator of stationary phase [Sandaracinus amylolyticus]